MLGPFAPRPRLLGGMALGIAVALGLWLTPNAFSLPTRFILAWDTACIFIIVSCLLFMRGTDAEGIKARAADQDEGRGFIITLSLAAAGASLVAVGLELSLAQHDHGLDKAARIVLAFVTVAASWLFVQMIFCFHYAHEFYGDADHEPGGPTRGGLKFPGENAPDYWDFLHFAVIIGVACQTADIAFTSRTLRRIGTVHGVVAFLFNTVILALTINLSAGLVN